MKKLALALSLLGLMCGCGGGGGGGTPAPPAISVSLAPSAQTTIDQGQTVNFTATVRNDSGNRGVTWTVSGTGCTGDACGTFTNSAATTVTYNAPTPVSADLTVSVKATSAADTSKSASSTVVVKPAPSITTTTLPSGTAGTAYSTTLQATGGVGTLTWSVATGLLPAGLSLSISGTLSGTPTSPGSSTFTVQVTDSAATPVSAQQQLSITINPGTLTITTPSLPNGVVDTAYTATPQASGGTPPVTWSVTVGTLPDGLSLDPSTGVISGAPTAVGLSNITLTATDSATPTPQTANKLLSITINAAPAACTSSGNESVLNGKYAFTLSGYNGTGFLAMVGSFTADTAGNLSAIEVDSNGVLGVQYDINNASTSSYSVGSDNRGCATIATSFGTFTMRFALGSISSGIATKGRIIEWESPSASAYIAAGQIWRQDSASFSSELSGNYVMLGMGDDGFDGRLGLIGVFTGSGSTISNGEFDGNDAGDTLYASGVTGSYTIVNVTDGRATGTLSSMGLAIGFAAYRVSASEIIFITTDAPALGVLSGEMRKQSGTFSNSSLNAKGVFYLSGWSGSGSGSDVTFGTLTGNGSGTANFTVYDDYEGSLSSGSFSCTYTVASNGRTTLTGNCSGAPVLYLTAANTGLMLGMDFLVQSGEGEPQATGSFNNASLSGTFFFGDDAVISQSVLTVVGSLTYDGAGNTDGIDDITSTSGQNADIPFTVPYAVNPDGTSSVSPGDPIISIVISNSKLVRFNQIGFTYPSILVIEK